LKNNKASPEKAKRSSELVQTQLVQERSSAIT